MPKVKKLPKWAIRQAGGINKKAWALARRGKTSSQRTRKGPKPRKAPRRRSAPRSVGGASHTKNSKPGMGRWFKIGRTVDVFSGPAHGGFFRHGINKEGLKVAGLRYSAGMSEGSFDADQAKGTYGGIGTGLVRDWIRSKMGVYRGLGQKKILSGVMAANPEILATSEFDPVTELSDWNRHRMMYDRAYDTNFNVWDLNPESGKGERFWKSIGLDAGLKIGQKVAEKVLNPLLPPGINL